MPPTLTFGTVQGINLNLIDKRTTTTNKTYYYLDNTDNGTVAPSSSRVTGGLSHNQLDDLLFGGADTVETQMGGHDGTNDERSVIINGYTLILPTIDELLTFRIEQSYTESGFNVWTANLGADSDPQFCAVITHHTTVQINGTADPIDICDTGRRAVFFEVQPPAPSFDITIPTQTYPRFTDLPDITLPTARAAGPLSYTLALSSALTTAVTVPVTGLAFDAATQIINGKTTTTTPPSDLSFVYTVTDTRSTAATFTINTASQAFTIKRVHFIVDGDDGIDGTIGYTPSSKVGYQSDSNLIGTIEVNNVGGNEANDMRLILPESHTATTFTVTNYDMSADTVPDAPVGVTFGNAAMDIDLTDGSLDSDTTATVCLSLGGRPEGRIPTIYRLPAAATAWVALTPATTPTTEDFVCGTTDAFSPFAVGYALPVIINDTDPLAQIYQVGQAVALTLPLASGGTGMLTYTLTPRDSIPDGLSFVSDTRTLGGIPTTVTPLVTLTYTAIDDTTVMESLTFTVTVVTDAPLFFDTSVIPAPDPAYTYLINTPITSLTLPPASGGIGMPSYTLTPSDSIPDGLTFDGTTPMPTLAGTPTTVTPLVTLIYTATDNTTPVALTDSLTFTVTIVSNTTRLNEQILTRASQAMTASTMAAVAARVGAGADGAGAGIAGTTGAGATPTLAYQFGGQSIFARPAGIAWQGDAGRRDGI